MRCDWFEHKLPKPPTKCLMSGSFIAYSYVLHTHNTPEWMHGFQLDEWHGPRVNHRLFLPKLFSAWSRTTLPTPACPHYLSCLDGMWHQDAKIDLCPAYLKFWNASGLICNIKPSYKVFLSLNISKYGSGGSKKLNNQKHCPWYFARQLPLQQGGMGWTEHTQQKTNAWCLHVHVSQPLTNLRHLDLLCPRLPMSNHNCDEWTAFYLAQDRDVESKHEHQSSRGDAMESRFVFLLKEDRQKRRAAMFAWPSTKGGGCSLQGKFAQLILSFPALFSALITWQ